LGRPFPGRVLDAVIPPVDGNDAIVVATGDIDVHTAWTSTMPLSGYRQAPGVVVDLSAVTFMDSSGLGVLVAAQQRRAGALVVRGPCASVAKVLAYTGLHRP